MKKRVCVFCGSKPGQGAALEALARAVGEGLAARGVGLVYGGARVGLMGAVADAALGAGAEVIGVLPTALAARELAHGDLTALHLVASMHERKARMSELSHAFLTLPGGFGTLDELFEVLTWRALEIHTKPCFLLNAGGYFDALLAFVDRAEREGMIAPATRALLRVGSELDPLLDEIVSALDAPRATPSSRAPRP
ncbi:MAG TPA: TIGR00730 family Rossman fold protein [Polyangiaceae bacterium]|nr:TIGR00730 family Rossman fold protein [Polyangiaceae bacterium]